MNNLLIGVIGAGQMGAGIAAACTVYGFAVKLVDANSKALDKSKINVQTQIQKLLVSQSNLHAIDVDGLMNKISYHTEVASLQDVDLVIEAIPEIFELKQELYKKISNVVRSDAIIATNTSSFPITKLAVNVEHPGRFIGIHFMNPVLRMNLVELIPGQDTRIDVLSQAKEFVSRLQKKAVISMDQPGFIVNRLLIPMINQSFIALESGLASAEDIDAAMEDGASFPMGPLKLADFIGLDTCLAIMETLNERWPNTGYAPSSLLKKYVDKGAFGRKTKQGVYSY